MRSTTPTVLIAGSPRSGTTLLASTLNSQPEVCIFAEFGLTRVYRTIDAFFASMEDRQFAPFDPTALEQFLRPTFTEHNDALLAQLYGMLYPHKVPRIIGSKAAALAASEDLDFLVGRIPDLRIIYVMRNCVDVVRSSMERRETASADAPWGFSEEKAIVDEWLYALFLCRYLKDCKDILILKYEDVVNDQASAADQVSAFLDIETFDFQVRMTRNESSGGIQELAGYSTELSVMLARWGDLSADEIVAYELPDIENLDRSWRHLGIPLCDLGTMVNFHDPETWGVWSKPGFFELVPRALSATGAGARVEIDFLHSVEELEAAELRAVAAGQNCEIELRSSDDGAIATLIPAARLDREDMTVTVEFRGHRIYQKDPRALGLRVRKYRLLWD
jgi:hypothetical protein